jgi:arylsulfatase
MDTLLTDGKQIAKRSIQRTAPIRYSLDEGRLVGEHTGTPVNLSYDAPFKFTGKLDKVTIDLKPTEAGTAKENEQLQRQATTAKALRD